MTDAKGLYDNLQKDGSVLAERQTLLDALVAKDLVERKCIDVQWFPKGHQFPDLLTKATPPTASLQTSLRVGAPSLVPTDEQAEDEAHCLVLRRGQRQRAKERQEARNNLKV